MCQFLGGIDTSIPFAFCAGQQNGNVRKRRVVISGRIQIAMAYLAHHANAEQKETSMNAAFNEAPGASAVAVMAVMWLGLLIAAPFLALL